MKISSSICVDLGNKWIDSGTVFGLQKDKKAPLSIPREKEHYRMGFPFFYN